MIKNGGGFIDVTLCDGFLYCASVFSKSIAKATFSFPYVLDPAFGALYHVHEVRRRAGDVMPYTFLLVSSEESVRRGSFFNKTARRNHWKKTVPFAHGNLRKFAPEFLVEW